MDTQYIVRYSAIIADELQIFGPRRLLF